MTSINKHGIYWFLFENNTGVPKKSTKYIHGWDKYNGTLDKEGKVPHGHGVYTWYCDGNGVNGVKELQYIGCLQNGKKSGYGLTTQSDGGIFEGEYKDNDLNGKGIITWPNSYSFKGEFKNNLRNGHGEETWASGSKYVGEFKNDKKHGHGTFTWSDGDRYIGGYKDGKKHGRGRMEYVNGRIEYAFWQDDMILPDGFYGPFRQKAMRDL